MTRYWMNYRLHAERRRIGAGGTPPTEPTLWNTTDKVNITLTESDLRATPTAAAEASVNGTVGHGTGKRYFGFTTAATGSGTAEFYVGIRKTAPNAVFTVGLTGIAANAAATAFLRWLDGAQTALTVAGSFAALNSEGMFAVDFDSGLIWLKVGTGNWNNDAGADPATGVGGRSFSELGGGTFYPFFRSNRTAHSCRANFGASAFGITPPAGFTAWNG